MTGVRLTTDHNYAHGIVDVTQYLMSPHAYLCLTRDGAVFLDLRRDKYFGVGDSVYRALEPLVFGWPRGARLSQPADAARDPEAEQTAEALMAKGLLTRDRSGKSATPVSLESPELSLGDFDPDNPVKVGAGHIVHFLAAYIRALALLRVFSIERVVHLVGRRRQRQRSVAPFDLVRMRELMQVYLRIRALIFTSREACLFDSLVTVEFLARYGVFPTWVFGVKTAPFEAHSWVQNGTVVLNETPERARAYTPILAV